jgi:hypothetical protein
MNTDLRPNWLTRSLLHSVGLIIVGFIAVCLVIFLLFTLFIQLIVTNNRVTYSLYAGLIPLLLLAIGLALVLICSSAQLARRRRQLDAIFRPLGLEGRSYFQNGRQYHGSFSGRQVDVYLSRGPQLEIYLEAPLKTRLSLSPPDKLIEWAEKKASQKAVHSEDPALSRLVIYTADEAWTQALLSDPESSAVLQRLTASTFSGSPQVKLQPDALALRLYHIQIEQMTSESIRQKLSDLLSLARQAEALPPPEKVLQASPLETITRGRRSAFLLPSLGIIVAILIAGLVMVASCFALISLLGR